MKNNKHFLLYSILFFMALASVLYVSYVVSRTGLPQPISKANSAYAISSSDVSEQSVMHDDQGSTYFYITSEAKDGVYTLPENTSAAVIEYLAKKPSYTLNVDGTQTSLIQDDTKNIELKNRLADSEVNFLKLNALDTGDTHYYFQQMRCDGTPVYGSYINVHVNQDNEVYALNGALAKTDAQCDKKLSRDEAESAALDEFNKNKDESSVAVTQSSEMVFSPKLSDQENNASYISQRVEVCGELTCHAYFIDLQSGRLLYDFPTSSEAVNRYIRLTSGSTQRREGDPASTNASINRVYDIMGEVYNFYSGTFQRDSYNDAGGLLQVAIETGCPQIDANWNGSRIYVCSNTIAQDVLAHEFQHGVTQYAVDQNQSLEYQDESGALNESLSDVFAAALDSNDWQMGEDTSIGAIRDLKTPGNFNDPDSIFSPQYYCQSGDNGGVHINSGVFNKAFYLMSDGGTFPTTGGCTMTGVGRETAVKVTYKALTTYMKGNVKGNYKDMYNAMISACNDLYQSSSSQCQNIKIAMEAVAMDQQVVGHQEGAKCWGATKAALTCLGAQAPTGGPVPTSPNSTPSVTPPSQPSATSAPSPSPTEVPKSADAPLLSPWSLPTFFSGNVESSYDGKNYTIRAKIEAASLNSLMGDKREGFDDADFLKGRLVGSKTLETGSFKIEDGDIVNEFTSSENLSAYSTYEVYYEKTSDFPELPILMADVSGSLGSGSSQQEKISLTLKIRMQGIESKPKSTQAQLVRIGIGGGDLTETVYKKVVFVPSENGEWEGKVSYDFKPGSNFKVLVKGPRQLQKKYCDNNPKEDKPGQYVCPEEAIELKYGENVLDFTNVVQLAGDANQDGVVNSQDILAIRNNIGTSDLDKLIVGDMNNDGVLNAADDVLVIYTLSNRSDLK